MRIVIAGGHGQIALRLEKLLAERGDEPVGLVRNPDHVDDLRKAGAEAVVCDLEKTSVGELAAHLKGADAVVFAAGAGPGSGVERKTTVDKDAAILLADAAIEAGVFRYVLVSSMGADMEPPADTDPVFAAYLRAKGEADDDIRSRPELLWTVLRPGSLTDDPGIGKVHLAPYTERGSIPRDDVAAVLARLLTAGSAAGLTLDLISGNTPIAEAVETVTHP